MMIKIFGKDGPELIWSVNRCTGLPNDRVCRKTSYSTIKHQRHKDLHDPTTTKTKNPSRIGPKG